MLQIAFGAQNGHTAPKTKQVGVCATSRLGGASPAVSHNGDSPAGLVLVEKKKSDFGKISGHKEFK